MDDREIHQRKKEGGNKHKMEGEPTHQQPESMLQEAKLSDCMLTLHHTILMYRSCKEAVNFSVFDSLIHCYIHFSFSLPLCSKKCWCEFQYQIIWNVYTLFFIQITALYPSFYKCHHCSHSVIITLVCTG